MGFGRELHDFASGFRSGVQLANQTRSSQAQADRYKPAPEQSGDTGPFGEGGGPRVGEKAPSNDPTQTGSVAKGEIADYIRQSAARHGVDPDIAIRVAQSEGGLNDPFRQGEAMLKYGREESYGPFQLHMRMGGVGERALKEGIDPRKDWKAGVDYALQEASQKGWGQWFGAAKAGIKNWDGIGGPKRSPSSVKKAARTTTEQPAIPDDETTPIPEEEAAPAEAPVEEEAPPVEEAEVSFALPEVDLPGVTPWEEYARLAQIQQPQMFAQAGGVIPETNFANGGAVDPNTKGTYTQAVVPASGARPTFVPRRISTPVMPAATTAPGGLSPSQKALADARAKAAIKPAPVVAAPVVAPPTNDARMRAMIAYDRMSNRPFQGQRTGQNEGAPHPGQRQRFNRQRQQYNDPKYRDAWVNNYVEADTLRAAGKPLPANLRGFNYGFAAGGVVPSISSEYWEEAVRRERRPGRSDQEARDIAAKRINVGKRDLTSSAVKIGGRQEKQAGIKERPARRKSGGGTTASIKQQTVGEEPRDTGRLSPENAEPAITATPAQPKPGRLSDEYVLPEPVSELEELPNLPDNGRERDTSIGPGVELAIPDPSQAEPAVAPPNVPLQPVINSPPPNVPPPAQAPLPRPDSASAEPSTAPPQVTPQVVTDILNDSISTGPGAPPLDTATIKNTIVDAVENGSEQAIATVKDWLAAINDKLSTPASEATQQPRGALPEAGEAVGVPTPRPHAQSTGQFDWRDFLNMFLDESYEGPSGEGVLFARGGAVPEEDEEGPRRLSPRLAEAGYTTSATGERSSARRPAPAPAPAPEEEEEAPKYASVKPTRQLRDDVAKSLDSGIRGLTRIFGLGAEGAVPSPEDEPRQREGMTRLVKGEGAATPEEIREIDDAVDPERQLDEGSRQMNRLAATYKWYAERGRKDEAEAAAGSLLQYGSQRFAKLGSMAANQYELYEKTGDQEYLQGTINMLEQAYAMVPDGGNVDVSINPETGDLQVTRIDADGNERDVPLKASEIPALIKGVQSGSEYWNSIYRLADPQGARDEATAKRQEARDARTLERQEAGLNARSAASEKAADLRHERTLASDEKKHKWQVERDERQEAREARETARRYPQVDWEAATPLLAQAKAAQKALATDPQNEELIAANNQAGSALFEVIKRGDRDPAGVMADLGMDMELFDLVAPSGEAGAPAAEQPKQAPDGKWYKMGPNGKYIEVEPVS